MSKHCVPIFEYNVLLYFHNFPDVLQYKDMLSIICLAQYESPTQSIREQYRAQQGGSRGGAPSRVGKIIYITYQCRGSAAEEKMSQKKMK